MELIQSMTDVSEKIDVKPESAKEKISVSLPVDLIDQIDDTLFSLRRKLPRHQRKWLTKSAFYELIMTAIVGNFNEMTDKSLIVKLTDDWIAEFSERDTAQS